MNHTRKAIPAVVTNSFAFLMITFFSIITYFLKLEIARRGGIEHPVLMSHHVRV